MDNRTSSRGPKQKKSEVHDSDAEPEEDFRDEDDSDEESEGGDQGKSLRVRVSYWL